MLKPAQLLHGTTTWLCMPELPMLPSAPLSSCVCELLACAALPCAGLFPSIIVGPLLGIAAVYGMKQNDLFAFRHKLFPPRQAPLKQ